jgi:hypothetical protein
MVAIEVVKVFIITKTKISRKSKEEKKNPPRSLPLMGVVVVVGVAFVVAVVLSMR